MLNDLIRGKYAAHMMRSLIVEEIAHHICTSVSSKGQPPTTAPILFGKENGAMAMGAPQSMMSQIIGPVYRFLSLWENPEARIYFAVKLMTDPLAILKIMAEYSPEDLRMVCLDFDKHKNDILNSVATAAVNYFAMSHTGLLRTANWIMGELDDEAGTVFVDTARIYKNAHPAFWENADLAIQVRKKEVVDCENLLESYQRRSADLYTDYDSWIAEVDLTNAHLIDQMLGPEKPVTLN